MNGRIKRPFIPVFVFFSLGILTGETFNISFLFPGICLSVSALWLFFIYLKKKKALFVPLIFFYFAGIIFILPVTEHYFFLKAEKSDLYNNKKNKITAEVLNFPEKSSFKLKAEIKLLSFNNKAVKDKDIRLKLTVYNFKKKFKPGDVISFSSEIRPFTNFKNPRAFDYKSYMRHKGFYGYCWTSADNAEFKKNKKSFNSYILNARKKIAEIIDIQVEKKEIRALLKTITAGFKNKLNQDFKDAASYAGASHFMAISGLHIGMVFSFIFVVSKFFLVYIPFLTNRGLVKKAALISGVFAALIYSLLSGLMPSAQRAIILAALAVAGFFLNKKHDPLNILAACAFFILAVNPQALFDIGFILSFSAVFFIISGFMLFPEDLREIQSPAQKVLINIKILLKTSLFAAAGTYPFALYFFYTLPFAGVINSCILIPVFSFFLLPSVFLGIMFFPVSELISGLFFEAASFCADFFINFVYFVSDFSFIYLKAGITKPELVLIFMWILLIFAFVKTLFSDFKLSLALKAGFVILFVFTAADVFHEVKKRFFNDKGRIISFDTGKGNSALIIFPGGKTALIDAGGIPGSDFDIGRYIIAPFLFHNKIKTIDYCIATHGDFDHYYGFFYLMDAFKINNFVFNRSSKYSDLFLKLKQQAEEKNIIMPVKKQNLKRAEIDFFQRKKLFENENDNSLLVSVKIDGVKILFTGDLYKKSQAYYRDKKIIKNTDILMVPHHGSKHSFHKGFVLESDPEIAVISGSFRDYEKTQKKIAKIYKDLGIKVYNVNVKGAFSAEINKNSYKLINF
ncbi:MAG: DNA internalization-related competence protein ComEC/Rec2 [Thermodesulfobacteriota bacterium]